MFTVVFGVEYNTVYTVQYVDEVYLQLFLRGFGDRVEK